MAQQGFQHVHRLPILDDQHNQTGNHVLLNVSSQNDTFPFRIEATEGEAPYHTILSQQDVSKLHDKRQSKEDWEDTLLSVLLQRSPAGAENLEVIAILSPQELSIIIRRNIEGIKQRLGEILVRRDDDYEIDPVVWTHTAVSRGNTLAGDIQSLECKFSEQQSMITKLNKKLDDLITAKSEHETALMTKCCELLNAKKLKIRDQQRLLASAKVDPSRAAEVQVSRINGGRRSPGDSRKGKRKGAPLDENEDEDEDEEDAFTDVKEVKREDSEEEEQRRTPQASDEDATEDEDEDGRNGGQPNSGTSVGLPDRPEPAPSNDQAVDMHDPPPSRNLPFERKDRGKAEASKATQSSKADEASTLQQEAGNEDEETTDDDEL